MLPHGYLRGVNNLTVGPEVKAGSTQHCSGLLRTELSELGTWVA